MKDYYIILEMWQPKPDRALGFSRGRDTRRRSQLAFQAACGAPECSKLPPDSA